MTLKNICGISFGKQSTKILQGNSPEGLKNIDSHKILRKFLKFLIADGYFKILALVCS